MKILAANTAQAIFNFQITWVVLSLLSARSNNFDEFASSVGFDCERRLFYDSSWSAFTMVGDHCKIKIKLLDDLIESLFCSIRIGRCITGVGVALARHHANIFEN